MSAGSGHGVSTPKSGLSSTYGTFGKAADSVLIDDISLFHSWSIVTETLDIPTYDGSGVAIHPSVIHIPGGWNAHPWWLAMTPYPSSNNAFENPSILCSDDGTTWAAPDGLTNPVIAKPSGGYNSDPAITLDNAGTLHMWFREEIGTASLIKHTQSTDGVTWSTPTTCFTDDTAVGSLVSPACFYAGGQWVMLAVFNAAGAGTDYITRATADAPEGPWSEHAAVTLNGGDLPNDPFHLDARLVGGTVVAVIKCDSTSSGRNYLAKSDDRGQTLTVADRVVAHGYKLGLVPMLTEAGVSLRLMYDRLTGNQRWTTLRGGADLRTLEAIYQQGPYVVGDSYKRADAASIGTADSGQTYTTSGVPGIAGNSAYPTTATNTRCTIDSGLADAIASVKIQTLSANWDMWLLFRYTDSSNYLRFGAPNATTWQLQKVEGGSVTNLLTLPNLYPPASGDRISVRYVGSRITVFVNDTPIESATSAFNTSATSMGWQSARTDARFRDLTCRRP